MIFQNFVKGGTERVNYGLYEYPPGADIIFDFGNPACTTAYNSSRIVYNIGSANVTASAVPYNNPTPEYPILLTNQYGTMVTRYVGGVDDGNYLQWDWQSNANQTNIVIYRLNGGQVGGANGIPYIPDSDSAIKILGAAPNIVTYYDTSANGTEVFNFSVPTSTDNGRNGYNMIVTQANNSNAQYYWQNTTLVGSASNSITRQTSLINQTNYFGFETNLGYLGFFQYPFILTPKQIRQLYKCFSQRFFV
jgi:hypothetical protein